MEGKRVKMSGCQRGMRPRRWEKLPGPCWACQAARAMVTLIGPLKPFAASLTEKGLQAVELPSGRRQPLDSPVSPSKTQALSSAPRSTWTAWCFRAAWPSRKGGQ